MKTLRFLGIVLMTILLSVSFAACSSDDDDNDSSESFKNLELVAGNTAVIENGSGVTWASENEYIASVSGNTITAKRVGTVKISSTKGSFDVTVTPQYTLYDDPCMKWGCSTSYVKSFMSDYTFLGEKGDYLIYTGKGAASYVQYRFSDAALTGVAVYVPTSYLDELAAFISERYIYAAKLDDATGHLSPDKKNVVYVTATKLGSTYYYMVYYTDFSQKSSTSNIKQSTPNFMSKTRTTEYGDAEQLNQLTKDIGERITLMQP